MEYYNLLWAFSFLRVSRIPFILKIQTRINHETEIDPQTNSTVNSAHLSQIWELESLSNLYNTKTRKQQLLNQRPSPKQHLESLRRHFGRRWKLRRRPKCGSKPPNLLVQLAWTCPGAPKTLHKINNDPSVDPIFIWIFKNQIYA